MAGTLPEDWNRWRRQMSVRDYDERWRRMEASGTNPHGEADFVCSYHPRSVLDGGCGTGRVAIELARRGLDVLGVDLDQEMLALAQAKAPTLTWVQADLSELELTTRFSVIVLAGNVIPYVAAERRPATVTACSRHLAPGGRLIVGFQLQPGWPTVLDYDLWCWRAALVPEARFATWQRHPFTERSPYAVSVHRRQSEAHGR